MGDFLLGKRGLVHSPYDVTEDDFDILFIAQSLSRQGRYLGNGRHYLSVAEHCVELSYRVAEQDAFTALMHDAPEAFVGDVHSFIKQLMIDKNDYSFHDLEQHFWKLISSKYKIPFHLPAEVHRHDIDIRVFEMESLFGEKRLMHAWDPQKAEDKFYERAYELRPDIFASHGER